MNITSLGEARFASPIQHRGLNNVIRALFFELHHTYGVAEVLGFRGGYQGLDPVIFARFIYPYTY